MRHHEVVVIGAGHAGVEAARAAARMGLDVAICTLSDDTVAHMPCNPAIGGTAKGHLVAERIDLRDEVTFRCRMIRSRICRAIRRLAGPRKVTSSRRSMRSAD